MMNEEANALAEHVRRADDQHRALIESWKPKSPEVVALADAFELDTGRAFSRGRFYHRVERASFAYRLKGVFPGDMAAETKAQRKAARACQRLRESLQEIIDLEWREAASEGRISLPLKSPAHDLTAFLDQMQGLEATLRRYKKYIGGAKPAHRPRDSWWRDSVAAFAEAYTEASGRRATTSGGTLTGDGDRGGPFVEFVAGCLLIADPAWQRPARFGQSIEAALRAVKSAKKSA